MEKNEFLWPFLANNPLEISIWCILLISTFTTNAFKLNRQWSKARSAKILFFDSLSRIAVSAFRSLTRPFCTRGLQQSIMMLMIIMLISMMMMLKMTVMMVMMMTMMMTLFIVDGSANCRPSLSALALRSGALTNKHLLSL